MPRAASRAPLALAAATLGFLTVVAASQEPTPARATRRLGFVDLIREQDERISTLRAEVSELERRVGRSRATPGDRVRGLLRAVRRLDVRSGGSALRGPGVVVTLDDSPAGRSPTGDPNDLLVHERDIQTVVNALWSAGAEAVAVNGERLTMRSAVRCAGNTLLLHGRVHSPPYRISAIGDARAIGGTLTAQPGMDRLLDAVAAFGIRFDVETVRVEIPGGDIASALEEAQPA